MTVFLQTTTYDNNIRQQHTTTYDNNIRQQQQQQQQHTKKRRALLPFLPLKYHKRNPKYLHTHHTMVKGNDSSSSSSSEDVDEVQPRERKSKRKPKRKHRKRHHRDEVESESDDGDRRRSKKSKKRKKHDDASPERSHGGKSRRRRRGEDSSNDNSVSDDESNQSRHEHKKKKDKTRKKKVRVEKNENKSKSPETDPFVLKYGNFLPRLHDLLLNHSDLATELPYLLIKLCSGSSINLSQIPDLSISYKLKELFKILGCTALKQDEFIFDDNGNWKASGRGDERALVLVKLVRFLLNNKDLTMENVTNFEKKVLEEKEAAKQKIKAPKIAKEPYKDEMSPLMSMLLDTFQSKQSKQSSSLAQELCSIMQMIHDGEIICLDGLEDDFLKEAIEKFFTIMGLVKEEMDESDEEESDDAEDKDEKQVSYGYTLPNVENELANPVKQKLHAAISASKIYHDKKSKQRIGPILPKDASSYKQEVPPDSDESDDEGPAPVGSQKARARSMKRQMIPKQTVPNLMKQESKREEWMMAPGEHDFLKGVIASGGIKSRTFKNEKNSNPPPAPKPMNPEIQKQVDSIMDAHKEARGPSLVEQHRAHQAEEKAAKNAAGPKGKNGESWNWSRSTDLDAGRRVDKKYLNMVMGGASTDLKSKFQGSYSAGFT